jgi:hypothetical protein
MNEKEYSSIRILFAVYKIIGSSGFDGNPDITKCFLVTLHTLVPSHVILLFNYFNSSVCSCCFCLVGIVSLPHYQGQIIMELYLLPSVTLDGMLQRHKINFTSSIGYSIKSDTELLETNRLF